MVHGNWPKNDIGALVLHGRGAAQDMVNVFHFECDSVQQALNTSDAASQAAFDAILDDWRTNVMPTFLATIPANYTLPRISMQVVERAGQFEHRLALTERTYTTSITGTYTATVVTSDTSTASVVRWKTPVAGKSHRGRSYFPFPGTTAPGLLVSNMNATLATFADLMIARYAAGGGGTFAHFSLTVYSRPYTTAYLVRRVAGVPTVFTIGPYDGGSTNVTTRQIDGNLRVQRRREVGVGS